LIIKLKIVVPQCLKTILEGRGNGLRSKTHEPVLFERSEFTGECTEQLIESRELSTAVRRCGGVQGDSPCFAFLLQAFSFSNKKKMPKRGKYKNFDYWGTRR
jgi:hypothetical protein